MKTKRIISLLLTVCMLLGAVTVLPIAAADDGTVIGSVAAFDHLKTVFVSAQERLDAMALGAVVGDYELYCDNTSGEVGFKDTRTGAILLTNPYSIGSSKASASQKNELLSQLIVTYSDNGSDKVLKSYEEAGLRGQISVERIKNGIRVNYSMGEEETRRLVPHLISKDRFENEILNNITDKMDKMKMGTAYYSLKDASTLSLDVLKDQYYAKWPITREMAVYVLADDTPENDLLKIEAIIKTYCPDYTFEELDYDHEMTHYEGMDREPVNFKMSLEYTVDNGDLLVTLPANGIQYNEDEYTLTNIKILPYMGAGTNPNKGYTFFPDGSGSLFCFEDLNNDSATTVTAAMYGTDYAYQTISGTYEQTLRVPVFGIVENEALYETQPVPVDLEETPATTTVYTGNRMRGFFAIMEEGEAMSQLSTYHGGAFHEYNTIQMTVTPRPKDSYNLATAISVGSNSLWTIVSERRYTGNYRTRYMLLTDPDVAKDAGLTDTYETSWQGMADAYQDYLVERGILTPLEDDGKDTPLYMETFGASKTVKKILSIPISVKAALTTFDQVEAMQEELASEGVANINFKLTGYANGGMYAKMPYGLKWEKAVGGKNGFKELLADAKEDGYGLYPDFDFAYLNTSSSPGVSLKKHAVKSLDNRYISKRVYSVTRQNYKTYYQMAMSPAYYYRFINKFSKNYLAYEPIGISVATLGNTLNSDFDKKEPYNREDSKNYTADAFENLGGKYEQIMTEGGNAYVWKDADHILNLPLDSSRYTKASYTVPFLGYVLHGYMRYTGTPINMAGDIRYEILKCIENGAYLYFIVSCDNTEILKEDEYLSKYYSIRYDIWHDDIVSLYTELNEMTKDLQTEEITDHEFLIGERIPDADETPDTEGTGKYTTMDDGRIVKVTYANGVTFLLNYNYFDVVVEGTEVGAYGYVRIG